MPLLCCVCVREREREGEGEGENFITQEAFRLDYIAGVLAWYIHVPLSVSVNPARSYYKYNIM